MEKRTEGEGAENTAPVNAEKREPRIRNGENGTRKRRKKGTENKELRKRHQR